MSWSDIGITALAFSGAGNALLAIYLCFFWPRQKNNFQRKEDIVDKGVSPPRLYGGISEYTEYVRLCKFYDPDRHWCKHQMAGETEIPASELEAIEITPAMLAAGLREFALFDSQDRGEWIVAALYRGMRATANQEDEARAICVARPA